MFTLDTEKSAAKTVGVYTGVTLFCVLFAAVYEQFSHGVYSNYMIFMFAFPLLGGVLPFLLLALRGARRYPGKAPVNLWNAAVATLTVGSCLQGVFEIYGTVCDLVAVYWITGAFLALSAVVLYMAQRKRARI